MLKNNYDIIVVGGGPSGSMAAWEAAKEGIWDIRRSGLQKAADGITSLAEVNRVTVE